MGIMSASGLGASSRRRTLLPPEGALFIRRRIEEILGLILIVGSAILLLAWLSYAPTDPSPLRAAPGPVKNLFGVVGAASTDVGVQAFGLGYLLFIAVLSIWGWRLFAHRGLDRLPTRLTALCIAVMTAAVAFGALPIATGVDMPTGPGGAIGQLVLGRVLALGPWIGGMGAGSIGIAAAVLGGIATIAAVGFGGLGWTSSPRAPAASPRAAATPRRLTHRPAEARADPLMPPSAAPIATPLSAGGGGDRQEPRLEPARKPGLAGLLRKSSADQATPRQMTLPLTDGGDAPLDLLPRESGHLPPVTLLAAGATSRTADPCDRATAQGHLLIAALEDFGVAATISAVRPGPMTTTYELIPAPGVKTARAIGLADDIKGALGASCIRGSSIPGAARPMIGVELPNPERPTLTLRPLLCDPGFERTAARLTLALGRDGVGAPLFADLGRLPHLLIAGSAASGKTTLLHSLLLSVLYRLPAADCRLLLIATKPRPTEGEAGCLRAYADIPHLLTPVVTQSDEGLHALRWAVREMEQRYRMMAKIGVRNVESYNHRVEELATEAARRMRTVQTGFDPIDGTPVYEELRMDLTPLPLIVVAIDDLGPLMRLAALETEAAIQRLSQMARSVGIHLLVTADSGGPDAVTDTVKAQFVSRICLRAASKLDSRALIGEAGAEQLMGRGDALYMSAGGKITRLHAAMVGADELDAIVRFLRKQGEPSYVSGVTTTDAALNSPKREPMTAG